MTPEQTRTALIDPRIPPLVHVLRDGTDEQVEKVYLRLMIDCGIHHGGELWDQALREVDAMSEPEEG